MSRYTFIPTHCIALSEFVDHIGLIAFEAGIPVCVSVPGQYVPAAQRLPTSMCPSTTLFIGLVEHIPIVVVERTRC